jgi:hypothetical protein
MRRIIGHQRCRIGEADDGAEYIARLLENTDLKFGRKGISYGKSRLDAAVVFRMDPSQETLLVCVAPIY